MYHHRKTIWLDFGARMSKVKGHRGQLMKFHTLRLLSWYLKNHWRCKNFKLKDSMYHHRKTIWLDFGARRSKVKGHRGQLMKFHTLRLLSWYLKNHWRCKNFKLKDSMYHHRKTIWLDFGARRSKVKGHRGQLMKFHTLRLLSWYLKNHWRFKLQT